MSMPHKFKNIAIIGRQNSSNAAKTLLTLIKHLKTKKINIFLELDSANILPKQNLPVIRSKDLKKHCDLIIVIGGDGSMLSASRIAASQNLPILGINRGNLGFLTDIKPTPIAKIDSILSGKYCEESRFLLKTSRENKKNGANNNLALNEIALFPSISGHMIEFSVHVDQQFLCAYRSDGLIIATPTGSTAHALSSGGPILYPTLENIVLVPVLSHNLSSRPIVISSKSEIEITFDKTTEDNSILLCDGQIQKAIIGKNIKITKAKEKLRLLHPAEYNYFETLRTKLNWERENKKI